MAFQAARSDTQGNVLQGDNVGGGFRLAVRHTESETATSFSKQVRVPKLTKPPPEPSSHVTLHVGTVVESLITTHCKLGQGSVLHC